MVNMPSVSKQNISHRIFVVGCPRSGTTLLQSAIMAAEETWSRPETHFFVRLESRATLKSRIFGDTAFYTGRYRKWLTNNGLPLRDSICRDRRECGRKFAQSMDALAASAGKSGWMEKSPNHIWHLEAIQESIPDARIIHIVRSARANIGSLLDWASMNGMSMSPMEAFEVWLKHLGRSVCYLGNPSHLIVSYDDLMRDFDREMEKVSRFTGLSIPALKDLDLRKFSQQIVRAQEVWKQKNLAEAKPRDSGLEKYDRWVAGSERQVLEDSIRRVERLLGR